MNITLNGKEFTFTTDQYDDLVDHVVKEQKRKKLESALAARKDDPAWEKVVTTLRAEDIYDMSEKFDNMVSDYTGEDEEEALLSMYKEVDKSNNKPLVLEDILILLGAAHPFYDKEDGTGYYTYQGLAATEKLLKIAEGLENIGAYGKSRDELEGYLDAIVRHGY